MSHHIGSVEIGRRSSVLVIAAVWVFAGVVGWASQHQMLTLIAMAMAAVALMVLFVTYLRLAVMLAVFAIPLEDFFVVGGAGTAAKLLLLVLAGSYMFQLLRGRMRPRWGALPKVGWIWLCWAAASLFWSVSPQVDQLVSLVQLVVLAFLVAAVVSERPAYLPGILWAYTLSACTIAVLGIMRYRAEIQQEILVRTSGGAGQGVEHFAAYLIPAALLLVVYALDGKRPLLQRVVAFGLCALPVFGLLISGTRSAWMGFAVALAVAIVPTLRVRQLLTLAVLVGVLVVAVSGLPELNAFVGKRAGEAVTDGGAGRVDIWKVGLDIVSDAPLTGVGLANFPMHFGINEIREATFGLSHRHLYIGRAPHSIYLGSLSELGIVGLCLILAWFVPLLLMVPAGPRTMLVVRSALLAFLIQGMYLDILNRKYFWLFLGLAEACRWLATRGGRVQGDEQSESPVAYERLPQRG